MIANGQFVAELVLASAQGLASITAQKLLERRPQVAARFGPDARTQWRDSVISRLEYLAAALSTGSPAILANQFDWSRIAHEARGGTEAAADFDEAIRLLREVLLQELPGPNGQLAASYLDRAMTPPKGSRGHSGLTTPHRKLAAEFLLAILDGDRRKACSLILAAAEPAVDLPGLSVQEIYLDVLIPAQRELGRMWHLNEIGIAEEHFATATTQLVMSQLYQLLPFQPPNGKVVVAASVEGNAHDLGVRMLGDLLESAGWKTVYLGSSVPGADLASGVDCFHADLLALSAGLGTHLPTLAEAISQVRKINKTVKILVGGHAFSLGCADEDGVPLWKRLGADGFAANVDSGVRESARLVELAV